jgi:hypothetical protein
VILIDSNVPMYLVAKATRAAAADYHDYVRSVSAWLRDA